MKHYSEDDYSHYFKESNEEVILRFGFKISS